MVCTATELSKLENFPKGLRVLLLDEDSDSCRETKSKLESMDYIVSVFSKEDEALAAVLKKPESFHIAIVEVSTSHENGSFKFLEAAKDLPTVMTSNLNCLSTMMQCIALGAVEFLHKPLSEDKLKNIWQHVVHKAFNVVGNTGSRSLNPVKESVVSMLHLPIEIGETVSESTMPEEEKDPAPSTPQLKQTTRLVDDQENANCSTENATSSAEKESGDHDIGESKLVDTSITVLEAVKKIQDTGDPMVGIKEEKQEDDLRSDNTVSLNRRNNDELKDTSRSNRHNNKLCVTKTVSAIKSARKKVDWTPELHKRFVQAVEQLGVDQAIPSRILELMKVDGLTRHNVASHLQKYRMHRRSILPKEDERRWIRPRDQLMQTGCYPHRPVMAAYRSPNVVGNTTYPVWGVPGGVQPSGHTWGAPGYPSWQPNENWHWRPYPAMHGNAWGCPYPLPPPPANGVHRQSPPNASGIRWPEPMYKRYKTPHPDTLDPPLEEEVIDKVVKEAINKPWLPLPLGLKPPSTDVVLSELSRQGIPAVPCINGSSIC